MSRVATPDKKTSWSPNSTVPIATPAEKTSWSPPLATVVLIGLTGALDRLSAAAQHRGAHRLAVRRRLSPGKVGRADLGQVAVVERGEVQPPSGRGERGSPARRPGNP